MLPPVSKISLKNVLNSPSDNSVGSNAQLGSRMEQAGINIPSNGIIGRYLNNYQAPIPFGGQAQNDNSTTVIAEIRKVRRSNDLLASLMLKSVSLLTKIQSTLNSQLAYQRYAFELQQREDRENKLERGVSFAAANQQSIQKQVGQKSDKKGSGFLSTILKGAGLAATAEAVAPELVAGGAAIGGAAIAPVIAGTAIAGAGYFGYKAYKGAKGRQTRERQIYQLLRSKGLSDSAAVGIMAEIGRENGFQDRYLFGSHIDSANHLTNIGMLSWQGSRADALRKQLESKGLIRNGKVVQSVDALSTQIDFMLQELRTGSAGGSKKQMRDYMALSSRLGGKVSDEEMARIFGLGFIRWNPRLAPSGIRNREYFRQEVLNNVSDLQKNPNVNLAKTTAPSITAASLISPNAAGFIPRKGGNAERQADSLLASLGIDLRKFHLPSVSIPSKRNLSFEIWKATGGRFDPDSLIPTNNQMYKEKRLAANDQKKFAKEQDEIRHYLQPVSTTFTALAKYVQGQIKESQQARAKAQTLSRIREGTKDLLKGKVQPDIRYKLLADGTKIMYDGRTGAYIKVVNSANPRLEQFHKLHDLKSPQNVDKQRPDNGNFFNIRNDYHRLGGGGAGTRTSPRLLPHPGNTNVDLYHLYFDTKFQ